MTSLRNLIPRYNPMALIDSTTTLPQIHQIHAHLLVAGFLRDPSHYAKLVADLALSSSSSSSSHLPYAHLLLRFSPHPPSLFALNSLIRAHSKGPDPLLAFSLYRRLLRSLPPDHFTFTFLVRAAAAAAAAANPSGAAVHAAALRRGHAADPHVQSGLIHMYAELSLPAASRAVYDEVECPDLVSKTAMVGTLAQCGEVDSARDLFDGMPQRDPVAWNAMIAGYVHVGRSREALELFSAMQSEGVRVGEATMVSVLTACAHLGALDQGNWAYAYVQKHKLRITVTLGTALIDMYSKCGNIERAMEVFGSMRERNVYTWSSAIGGLAMNGASEECLELFDLMKQEGVQPNAITFLSVLRACCVAGLVDRGRAHFDSMGARHGIEPWHEHYGCVVDLYGRAGRLGEALAFINAMPMEPHAGAWGALLHACRLHGDVALGEHATREILKAESANDAAHVLLSNTYAASRNWAGVSRVRESMKAKGVRKEPGCSAIEVGGEIHEFFAGDKTHRRYQEIEEMLGEMATKLREAGHVARTEGVLFDIEEEEKEDALSWHSEKLAIAFGLIALERSAAIRIVKNLRVCWDCHEATKVISKAYEREIVVRDRNRFHHFKGGVCSCMDYW